ncbi:hypothetical protein [Ferruginibacter sp. SUN106]|uniref:hypothetical protein n=1 Tax=Ferruginibacter sp. SUN106 TaxID=2978348 RepID=UPI003D365C4C
MKKIVLSLFYLASFYICNAQGTEIINNQKVITNEMIFYTPFEFKKNKQPLFLVNDKEVATIAFYNREELKKITVIQPNAGNTAFGKKGKNGVIVVELKDPEKTPEVEILTNKIYYKCAVAGKIVDTTQKYYDDRNGKNCAVLDLRDTSNTPVLYSGFSNEIKITHLGVGWDMTTVSVSGATATRSEALGNYKILIKKETPVKITISTCTTPDTCKQKEIIFRVIPLPKTGT